MIVPSLATSSPSLYQTSPSASLTGMVKMASSSSNKTTTTKPKRQRRTKANSNNKSVNNNHHANAMANDNTRCADGTLLSPHFAPSEYDVVCGRGKGTYNRPGNVCFRALCETFVPAYSVAKNKLEKTLVLNTIIHRVKEQDRRFVKQMTATSSNNNKRWLELSDERAREKVGHALREVKAAVAARCSSPTSSLEELPLSSMAAAKKKKKAVAANPTITSQLLQMNDTHNKPLEEMMDLHQQQTTTLATTALMTNHFSTSSAVAAAPITPTLDDCGSTMMMDAATSFGLSSSNNSCGMTNLASLLELPLLPEHMPDEIPDLSDLFESDDLFSCV